MSRVLSICLAGAASVALLSATPALAAGNAAAGLQAMRDFDLIVLGDMTTNGDVEGRALITGKLSGTGDFFTSPHGQTTANLPGLIVGGNITTGQNLNNGSGAWVGGSLTGQLNLNGGGTVLVGGAINTGQNNPSSFTPNDAYALANLPMSLADYASSLKLLSTALSNLAPTQLGPTTLNSGKLVLDVTGGGSGTAVIDISDALLSGDQISINTEGYSTVVINVAGAADTYQFNPGTFSTDAQTKIIWNFYQATTLGIQGQFEGSILAPLATMTNNTQVNGSVVVAGFNQGGEVHMNNYEGRLQLGVPEPATWAMMLMGFFGLGASVRRQRRLAAA